MDRYLTHKHPSSYYPHSHFRYPMLLTSYFAKSANAPGTVSITRYLRLARTPDMPKNGIFRFSLMQQQRQRSGPPQQARQTGTLPAPQYSGCTSPRAAP